MHVDRWRDVASLGDEQLADAVRADGIDILVDLAAHSGHNRLLTFARKPAPVQVTYLAYCSTTGVDAIDYRVTDRFLDPPAEPSHYTETSMHLPHCYWCYSAPPLRSRAPRDGARRGAADFRLPEQFREGYRRHARIFGRACCSACRRLGSSSMRAPRPIATACDARCARPASTSRARRS